MNRRLGAVYVFVVYLMAAASETYISPFFPLVREELGLVVAQQATLIAVLTFGIGFANVVGGAAGYHVGDRRVIRVAAATMGAGALVSGTAGSFAALVVGQAIAGVGIGLFFAPGLASIGRMFAESRGRAVASYGLGYSVGTGIAALAASISGVDWRWPFYLTAVLCVGLAVFAPPLPDSIEGTAPPMWASLRRYLREPFYQMSLVTALVAGSITYLFIGFTPTLFVDRGLSLAVAATVVAAGRFASVP
jgi:MFS family permease